MNGRGRTRNATDTLRTPPSPEGCRPCDWRRGVRASTVPRSGAEPSSACAGAGPSAVSDRSSPPPGAACGKAFGTRYASIGPDPTGLQSNRSDRTPKPSPPLLTTGIASAFGTCAPRVRRYRIAPDGPAARDWRSHSPPSPDRSEPEPPTDHRRERGSEYRRGPRLSREKGAKIRGKKRRHRPSGRCRGDGKGVAVRLTCDAPPTARRPPPRGRRRGHPPATGRWPGRSRSAPPGLSCPLPSP